MRGRGESHGLRRQNPAHACVHRWGSGRHCRLGGARGGGGHGDEAGQDGADDGDAHLQPAGHHGAVRVRCQHGLRERGGEDRALLGCGDEPPGLARRPRQERGRGGLPQRARLDGADVRGAAGREGRHHGAGGSGRQRAFREPDQSDGVAARRPRRPPALHHRAGYQVRCGGGPRDRQGRNRAHGGGSAQPDPSRKTAHLLRGQGDARERRGVDAHPGGGGGARRVHGGDLAQDGGGGFAASRQRRLREPQRRHCPGHVRAAWLVRDHFPAGQMRSQPGPRSHHRAHRAHPGCHVHQPPHSVRVN
mmetsp:Transcript_28759/g.55099  ORF Transcript_28759/g.55099 Transcript_28759/m.55099 type:complete len:305 (-) Transcript_28759:2086-3000(-)